MQAHETNVVQIVRVLDSLVRPVVQNDPELLAAWENWLALPRAPKSAGGVVVKSAGSTQAAGGTSPAVTPIAASSTTLSSTTPTAMAA